MKPALNEKWIVCRVCLRQPNEAMLTIFDTDASKDMTQMLLECGGVPIKQFDHYPDKICTKCLKYLRIAYKFRLTCQRSYKHLSRFIAPVDVDKDTDVVEVLSDEASPPIAVQDDSGDATIIFEDEDSKEDVELQFDDIDNADISVKKEFSEVEDEVVDIFMPMDDDLDEEDEFDSIDREFSKFETTEVVEYLDELGDEISTNDEEYDPGKKVQPVKKRPRGRPPKYDTNRPRPIEGVKSVRVKREPRSKEEKVKSYICDVCGNIYPNRGRLREHMKSHNGLKPHECEICGYAFAQNQQLARHMNTHTGNRPYKCNYCSSAFADLSTRNKHHRIHTNERPYVCDVCGKAFSYTNTLKFHKMTHTGEKPFVCDICGKGFHQAYKLRNHNMIHLKKMQQNRVEKVEVDSMEGFQEINDAAAQILGI